MCGRYAFVMQPLGRWEYVFKPVPGDYRNKYNIAPTTSIPVFTSTGWQLMRWGLVPSWSKEPTAKYSTFNARSESLISKPAYRSAWKHGQRCLVPATGYYEWRKEGASKQPYFIRSQHDEQLVFPGIWDRWEKGENELFSCSIITTEAQGSLKSLHHRMPIMLEPDTAELWLSGSDRECEDILQQPPIIDTRFYPVDKAVGNVRNQGEASIERI